MALLVLVSISLGEFRFNRNYVSEKFIIFGCQLKQHLLISMECSDGYQLVGCGYLMSFVEFMVCFLFMDLIISFVIKLYMPFFAYKINK